MLVVIHLLPSGQQHVLELNFSGDDIGAPSSRLI
jgi:hypothetical protein